MAADSYSLAEVAELLGVSKRALQRQIRDGAFPGRFLAPSPHGMEMRIPAVDVARAGSVNDSGSLPPTPAGDWSDGHLANLSNGPSSSTALAPLYPPDAHEGLQGLLREERMALLEEVRRAIAKRDAADQVELKAIRRAVETLTEEVVRLRESVSASRVDGSHVRWAETLGGTSPALDVDGLLAELGELEAMLGVPES